MLARWTSIYQVEGLLKAHINSVKVHLHLVADVNGQATNLGDNSMCLGSDYGLEGIPLSQALGKFDVTFTSSVEVGVTEHDLYQDIRNCRSVQDRNFQEGCQSFAVVHCVPAQFFCSELLVVWHVFVGLCRN
jgi:hypothetical protein